MTGPLFGPSPNQFHHQYCVILSGDSETAIDLPTYRHGVLRWIARDAGDYSSVRARGKLDGRSLSASSSQLTSVRLISPAPQSPPGGALCWSSISRTLRTSTLGVNGFCRKNIDASFSLTG